MQQQPITHTEQTRVNVGSDSLPRKDVGEIFDIMYHFVSGLGSNDLKRFPEAISLLDSKQLKLLKSGDLVIEFQFMKINSDGKIVTYNLGKGKFVKPIVYT